MEYVPELKDNVELLGKLMIATKYIRQRYEGMSLAALQEANETCDLEIDGELLERIWSTFVNWAEDRN